MILYYLHDHLFILLYIVVFIIIILVNESNFIKTLTLLNWSDLKLFDLVKVGPLKE